MNPPTPDAFERSPSALLKLDGPSHRIVRVNAAAAALIGADRVGEPLSSLFQDGEAAASPVPYVPSTQQLVGEDGRGLTAQLLVVPQADDTVLAIISEARGGPTTQDQRARLHVEQTPLAVIDWDLDFRVVAWNPGAERIFGYSEAEAMSQHAADLIVPAQARVHVDRIWTDLLKQRGGTRSTNPNFAKGGREILCEWYNTPLIDEDGATVGVASLVMDVTAREKNAQLVRQSEARYEAAQAAAQIANLDCDLRSGALAGAERLMALLGQPTDGAATLDLLLGAMDGDDRRGFQRWLDQGREDQGPSVFECHITPLVSG